jgi:hypothetical protein
MQHITPWIIAGLSGLLTLALLLALLWRKPGRARKPLPTEWSLNARPVFSSDERRVFRLLREALPHHVLMCKLPLVRFCQPTEAKDVRYWYELLGGISVNFAICSPNGRVLAAVDLETARAGSARSLQIKQAVLSACRVRYLRCSLDNLPSAAELQLLVPFSNNSSRSPQPAPGRGNPARRIAPEDAAAPRRYGRGDLWNDSAVFSDSFFAPDNRYDSYGGPSNPAPQQTVAEPPARPARGYRPRGMAPTLSEALAVDSQYPDHPYTEPASNDIAGVVIDSPRYRQR